MEEKEKNSRTKRPGAEASEKMGIKQRSEAARKRAQSRAAGTKRPGTAKAGTAGSDKREVEHKRPEGRRTANRRSENRRTENRVSEGRRPVRNRQSKAQKKEKSRTEDRASDHFGDCCSGGILFVEEIQSSDEKYDRNAYFGIEQEGQMAITVDNEVVEPRGMIADGKAYIQYETVRDYINSRFYWDPNENTLLYTLPTSIVSVEVGSKDYSVSNERRARDYVILRTREVPPISLWILFSSIPISNMKCMTILAG